MIETDRVSELICKYKITPNQVYILWLLYTADNANLAKYREVFGQFETKDFEELETKGLLIHTNRDALAYRTTDLVVTLDFAEHLVTINPDEAYDELFDVYPAWLIINQGITRKKIPAKTLTFPDEKAAREFYRSIVIKNKFIHHKILAAVNKWKEQNDGYATVKIDKFLTGRLWEEIEKEEDNNGTAKTHFN